MQAVDVLGIGFGPSNLALAIALQEHNTGARAADDLRVGFVERQAEFGWHRGMLIQDATMQVSFLKDLVTLRNPTSPLSFLAYLHASGRMIDFINCGTFYPTRLEFHDYLRWAAARFADQVDYGTTATAIEAVDGDRDGGPNAALDVHVQRPDGGQDRIRARHVVVAAGLTPTLPPGLGETDRVWHSSHLVHRVEELAARGLTTGRLVVVGAGQSAAESVNHLNRRFPDAEVCSVFARYGYCTSDDTAFANQVFDPDAVDDFHLAPPGVRDRILDYHSNTNYSVVRPELIEELFRRAYHDKVAGRTRLRFLKVSRVVGLAETEDRVDVTVESMISGGREVLRADAIVYATGYRSQDPAELLGDLAARCLRDEEGKIMIGRDYRVRTTPDLGARIYLQGATEHTHGLSSTLLSNVAVRAGEITAAITADELIARSSPAPQLFGRS